MVQLVGFDVDLGWRNVGVHVFRGLCEKVAFTWCVSIHAKCGASAMHDLLYSSSRDANCFFACGTLPSTLTVAGIAMSHTLWCALFLALVFSHLEMHFAFLLL
jgi:hypothetical protein